MFNKADFSLRKITENDLKGVLKWRNSDHIRNNMFSDHMITLEEHYKWFNKIKEDNCNLHLIFEKQSVSVGMTYFTDFDISNQVCSWGFYLGEKSLPRGMGTVLGFLSLEYSFEILGIEKLCGEVLGFNIPSIRLFQRLGFKESSVRQHVYKSHSYQDVVLFEMLKEEWKQHKRRIFSEIFYNTGE
ncbi:UDP-4-amino-4,6-dideoxy-N-acetyl-beta-L-altrosamine N-acetyltransferase [Pelosinus baikalensis]|uniref:UDP-4-amino-4, 6-dideoxy-N-acetyl-beta-L-altrosamine N-acetyltransferase n=1 Tax=Pelosinus baikalensis TaxID=2892015 RepID=A0ABS8HM63_9FIRM|nr:UDP-4-amino-4,6-dideoxy-N-acetyl-beta-L-altrosamine N-acetyltransferase [Pelosinus baikalensis]MCC5464037.1 UDP-4-amino-4,6-dideoxy-N-acetyl-beta-L-altrosamine N-acetyltransferase [Pelosinus baikalensis]